MQNAVGIRLSKFRFKKWMVEVVMTASWLKEKGEAVVPEREVPRLSAPRLAVTVRAS
jgi:hypothetical protein